MKKRKINDSLNHVTAERVGRIREINPESILEHLREIATYGDKWYISQINSIFSYQNLKN